MLISNRTVKLVSGDASATESIYEATIRSVGYRAAPSGHEYDIFESSCDGHGQYTVSMNSRGSYIVKTHISCSPIATITFTVEIVGEKCMIRRNYASSNLTTHYSILKVGGGWALGCCHDGVLNKLKGYTQAKLDIDACQAYDAGFFVMKLEEMADDEWVKIDG